jgi:formylglycine-generating enzyme required for sulfatase activity
MGWEDATKYCQWAGGQLPTEAQWEYAARGPQSYIYPWGNGQPNDELLNYRDRIGDTTPVGSYPGGASWVGALDMAGNVEEWVEDRGVSYPGSPQTNPTGPTTGNNGILRGGYWGDGVSYVRSTYRFNMNPDNRGDFYGFRCVAAPGG